MGESGCGEKTPEPSTLGQEVPAPPANAPEDAAAAPRFVCFGRVAFQPNGSPCLGARKAGTGVRYHLLYLSVISGISLCSFHTVSMDFTISITWAHGPLCHVVPAQARTCPCHTATVAGDSFAVSAEIPCVVLHPCFCSHPCVHDLYVLAPYVPASLTFVSLCPCGLDLCIPVSLHPCDPASLCPPSLHLCTPVSSISAPLCSCLPVSTILASLYP